MSEMLLNAIYADGHFEKERLGDLINKGGAAGKIYSDLSHPTLVAKIFHDKSKSSTNRQKLEAMLHNRPHIPPIVDHGRSYVQIAWPEAVLEDDNGYCVGYLMPLINTQEAVSLDHLMQKAVRRQVGLSDSYLNRLYAAYNVAAMVAALHKCKHYIVDLKPSNVSVYKENMLVAMFDCDGFSICGEKGRYPAEFVSEEYIYPEGMHQNCEDMGEEQDKFALAVIIFKLLNNGIHPFSGIPRKPTDEMLSLQTRIERYHYAYGTWQDPYQAPHPYSLHEYFDPKTLKMFGFAFEKPQNHPLAKTGSKANAKTDAAQATIFDSPDHPRPTAKEWQDHLGELLEAKRICKKNPDHIYFTNKGCGLCAIEEKFKQRMADVEAEKKMPDTVRGVEIKDLSPEKNERLKQEKKKEVVRLNKLTLVGMIAYFGFFGSLSVLCRPIKESLTRIGICAQLLLIALLVRGLYALLDRAAQKLPLLQNPALLNMLKIYAALTILLAFIIINDIGLSFLSLPPALE